MSRKPSVFTKLRESAVLRAANYRSYAKTEAAKVDVYRKLEAFHRVVPFPLPADEYDIQWNEYRREFDLTYRNAEHRAEIGRLFGIDKWEREVDSYTGNVSLSASADTVIGKINFVLSGASLAPGCKLVPYEVTEKRVRYRTECEKSES